MRKKAALPILVLSCIVLLSACGNGGENEKYPADEKAAELPAEKGYDLPISDSEREKAQAEGREIMELVADLARDGGGEPEAVFSEEAVCEMAERIGERKVPVRTNRPYSNMANYEKLESFLNAASAGESGRAVVFEIHSDGSIGRCQYTFDGEDMYVLTANFVWDDDGEPAMAYLSNARIMQWEFTEKGWFSYRLCVPEYPEVTEVVDGSCLIRVLPITQENREMSEKCVYGLGYRGNNLLCSDWEAGQMEHLDYNGMYEYLYAMKYGREFPAEKYQDGIPGEEFESLIMEYLPVTAEEIRSFAAFDEERQTYLWRGLAYSNHIADYFETSVPEVTDIRENSDGTLTLTVDAVCSVMLCDEAAITHELTVQFLEDGSLRYLGNKVLSGEAQGLPEYQYRIGE